MSTLSETLNGRRQQVGWEFVRAFARACDSYARDQGRRLPRESLSRLRAAWDATAQAATGSDGVAPGVRRVTNLPPRHPAFGGRRAEIDDLEEALSGARTVVLTGPGGVGKTQLALEHAHEALPRHPLVWWFDAEQTDLLGPAYDDLAVSLGLAATGTEDTVDRVRRHLAAAPGWLLVFDNATDPDSLRPWLPSGPGRTVITSRNPSWSDTAQPLSVEPLPRADSVQVLRALRPGLAAEPAAELAAALGDLPLALAQAGRFLAETGTSAASYLTALAAEPTGTLERGRPAAYPRSLAAAVCRTIDALDDVGRRWAEILALLAPENVPASLLDALTTTVADEAGVSSLVAADGLRELARYGLVVTGERGAAMHRLTQLVIAAQLDEPSAAARRRSAHAALDASLTVDVQDTGRWAELALVIPHVLHARPGDSDDESLARAALTTVDYLLARGQLGLGTRLAARLHERWGEHASGSDLALRARQFYATALRASGRATEALPLNETLLDDRAARLGPDDPETLWAAHDLAWTLRAVGRATDALPLAEDTLRRRRHAIGDDHLLTLGTATNVANLLDELGRSEEARALMLDTLPRYVRTVGDRHADTLMAQLNLAVYDLSCGRVAEARDVIEANLRLRQEVQGPEHPGTLLAAVNLAEVLLALDDGPAALEVTIATVDASDRVLGADHPETLYARSLYASALRACGEREAAYAARAQVVESCLRVLGPDHPDTVAARAELARDLG